MVEFDPAQWAADTERLLIAALSNGDGLNADEVTMEAVQKRCADRYGEKLGARYYTTLLGTLPDRRPELFPELSDFKG